VADLEPLMTRTAPPYRDYLTRGVSRSEALATCDKIAAENPELASIYLRWLVDEVRSSGWARPSNDTTAGGP